MGQATQASTAQWLRRVGLLCCLAVSANLVLAAASGAQDARPGWLPVTGTFVPFTASQVIGVPYIACRYPALSLDCAYAIEPDQHIQVSLLEVVRDAAPELSAEIAAAAASAARYRDAMNPALCAGPGSNEELVLVHLQIAYVDGPSYKKYEPLIAQISDYDWLADDGSGGRPVCLATLGRGRPRLDGFLWPGETTDGWLAQYISAGEDFVFIVREHPSNRRAAFQGDPVYFGTH